MSEFLSSLDRVHDDWNVDGIEKKIHKWIQFNKIYLRISSCWYVFFFADLFSEQLQYIADIAVRSVCLPLCGG